MSRSEALARGLKEFFDGVPCLRGHQTPRNAKFGYCITCRNEDQAKYRAEDPERYRAYHATWLSKQPKKERKTRRKEDGPDTKARRRKMARERNRKWMHENRDYRRAQNKARKANKKSHVPKWLTLADKKEIAAIYLRARDYTEIVGVEYEVDHIVPLRGGVVCGLHVPWNLQVLTREANLRKANKLDLRGCPHTPDKNLTPEW